MKRAWRWIKRLTLGVLAVVVVTIAFALVAVHTDWGRNLVREQVEGILAKTFPGGARIGKIEGSPFGTLIVTDIVLNGADGKVLVTVERAELEASLLPLLGGTVHVDAVTASGVTVVNPRAPNPLDETPPEPSAFSIELPQIKIRDARVLIEGSAAPLELAELQVLAALHIASGRPGDLRIAAWIGGRWANRDVPIAAFANLVVGTDEISLPFVTAGAAGAHLVATHGTVVLPGGKVRVSAPASAVARLAPGVVLPADAWVAIDAATTAPPGWVPPRPSAPTPAGLAPATKLALRGAMGASRLHGALLGELDTLTARGVIAVSDADLTTLSAGAVVGTGAVLIGVSASQQHLRGTVLASARVMHLSGDVGPTRPMPGAALIVVDATRESAKALLLATGSGDARVATLGIAHKTGDTIVIDNAWFGASASDVSGASGLRAPVRGQLAAHATAKGPIGRLEVAGGFTGRRVRIDTLGIADARGMFGATIYLRTASGGAARPAGAGLAILETGFTGSANASLDGITNAGEPVGKATVTARTRADRRIAVVANVVPAKAPLVADISAIVALPTPAGVIDIELDTHRIALPNGVWAGKGGTVRIDDRAIAVRDIVSASGSGKVAANATIGRATPTISASIIARDVALDRIDKELRGTVDATLTLERRGIRWKGGGKVDVHGMAFAPDAFPVDATLELGVDGRRVNVGVRASNPQIGGARVAVEVDGPRDLTDVDAWGRVRRGDLHGVTIGLDSLDARALSGDRIAGIFDGTIEIRDGVPDGTLRVRGIPTPVGTGRGDIALALDQAGFVDITGDASVGDTGDVKLTARIQIPDRPFDVAVYKRVGKNLVNGATVTTSSIAVTPELLAKLGIVTPYRGDVVATVTVGTGGSSVDVGIDAKNVTGGLLRGKLDAQAGVRVDANETTARLRVNEGDRTLIELAGARTPVSLDRWIAIATAPELALPAAAIEGTLTIPSQRAKSLLALVGRDDVLTGTLSGSITAGGTLKVPTAIAVLDLAKILVRPRLATTPPPMLKALHIDAAWDGTEAALKMTGEEHVDGGPPGTLFVEAKGKPTDLENVLGHVKIAGFEVSPLAAFLPGMLAGMRGKVEADLALVGFDPTTGNTRGYLALTDFRIPITPVLGTLRNASARIDVDAKGLSMTMTGKIGAGEITVDAASDPRGVTTTINATVKKLSPIGFLQPQISAKAKGTLKRAGLVWTGKLAVTQGLVHIPKARGNELLDDAVPADLIFVGAEREEPAETRLHAPTKPFLIVDVDVGTTRIEIPEFVIPALFDTPVIERGVATAAGRVRLTVGDRIGLDGEILVDRGQVQILGRPYTVELGQVGFDGTIDPLFDVKLSHEFPEVTTFVRFAGRLSTIDTLQPEFTSDPGTFSESQLFGFFLGGTPGADSRSQGQEALAGAGAALASGLASAKLRASRLPLKPDVVKCDPATSTAGASCMAGKYVTKRNIFVGGRYRFAPRVDENSTEGILEWDLSRRWTLEVFGGDAAIFGADILGRSRF